MAVAAVVAVVAAAVIGVLATRPSGGATNSASGDAVLLIPGYGGDAAPLAQLQASLLGEGYAVEVIDIGEGTGDLNGYADQVADRAQQLLDAGAASVSTVGFSAGGLIGRIAATGAPQAFDDVISLASPHQGTLWAALAGANCPTACQQMRPGSPLLESLPQAPDPSDWLSIYSTTDEVIVPADSSALPGATVVTVQSLRLGADLRHGQVPGDPAVIDRVGDFLAAPD